jgi:Ca2+-binding RTX toxin-like protein
VTNTGTIHGSIDLGDGNDHFDSHLGTYSSVAGGDGNDIYILGKGQHVSEDAGMGFDTVKSYASATLDAYVDFLTLMGKGNLNGHGNALDNLVYGNKGGNHLFGMAGEDTIGGKAGNDFLTGGANNDLFVFGKGDQVDTITDYTDGADTIYLKDFAGITNYSDIQSHMSQHGSDVWLAFGHGDKLIVQSTTLAELDSTAFSL